VTTFLQARHDRSGRKLMKPPVGISRRNEFQSTAKRGNVSNQSLRPPFVGPRWRIDITGFCSWRS
jgi:hypothetical protein